MSEDAANSSQHAAGSSIPGPNDIICGRGKNSSHPGNIRFNELVSSKKAAYQQAPSREEKTKITLDILQQLQNESCRFVLKDETNVWSVVHETYAKEKISHSLRCKRNEQRKKRAPQEDKRKAKRTALPAELEGVVQKVIQEQQQLLQSMIQNEMTEDVDQSTAIKSPSC
jgi:hypothetical protein